MDTSSGYLKAVFQVNPDLGTAPNDGASRNVRIRVKQSGGTVLPASPHDAEIAELSMKLDATRIYYGRDTVRKEQMIKLDTGLKIYKDASVQSIAQRAAFNSCPSGTANFCGSQELVNDFTTGHLKLEEVKTEQLPEDLQKLSRDELKAELTRKNVERRDLQASIQAASEKRQAWLKDELQRQGKEQPELDRIVFDAIKTQAATKGIEYSGDTPSL